MGRGMGRNTTVGAVRLHDLRLASSHIFAGELNKDWKNSGQVPVYLGSARVGAMCFRAFLDVQGQTLLSFCLHSHVKS